jgi:hypothetical protein
VKSSKLAVVFGECGRECLSGPGNTVFQKLFTTLHNITFFASLKLLIILKMLTETLLRIPFSVIGRCSLVPTSHWLQGKYTRVNLCILQNHKRLPVTIFCVKIAALGSLKRVSGRNFKISK